MVYLYGLKQTRGPSYYGGTHVDGSPYYATKKGARTFFSRYDAITVKERLKINHRLSFSVVKIKLEGF